MLKNPLQLSRAIPALAGGVLNSPPGLGGLRGLGSYAAYSLGWDQPSPSELPPTFPVSRQSTTDLQYAAPVVSAAYESSICLCSHMQIKSFPCVAE